MDLFNGFASGEAEDAGISQSALEFNRGYDFVSADSEAARSSSGYDWRPNDFNPRASSWDQVLQYGFARVVDSIAKPIMPDARATVPRRGVYSISADTQQAAAGDKSALTRMLLIGAGIFLVVKLAQG